MKLVSVKLANSVKVGLNGTESAFFQNKDYDLELKNSVLIEIVSKRTHQKVCSSLFNCIYFVPEEVSSAPDSSTGDSGTPKRSSSKK